MGLDNLNKYMGKKNNIAQEKKKPYNNKFIDANGNIIPKEINDALGIELCSRFALKEEIKDIIKRKDEIQAISRYKWENLPFGSLNSQGLERLIYLRYKLVGWKLPDSDNEFLITPYAEGGLDFYGQASYCTPVPTATGSDDKFDKNSGFAEEDYNRQKSFFDNTKLKMVYSDNQLEESDESAQDKIGIVLFDYTRGLGNTACPRAQEANNLIDVEANFIPYVNTAAINSTGVKALKTTGSAATAIKNAEAANNAMRNAAMQGNTIIPVLANMSTEQLANDSVGKTSEFMQGMQSIDNFRLSRLGISAGSMFEKNSHLLESEEENTESVEKMILDDGLKNRQNFAELFNKVFGTNIIVSLNEDAQPEEGSEEESEEDSSEEPNEVESENE